MPTRKGTGNASSRLDLASTSSGTPSPEFRAEVKNALSRAPIFRSLSERHLDGLVALVRIESFHSGEMIFQKGDAGDCLYLILQGRVGVNTLSPDGKEVFLNILEPGDVLGEIAMLDGKERTAGAIAMRPTTMLRIAREDFIPYLEQHAEVCLRMIELLCQRIRWVSEIVEEAVFLDIPARLARRLLVLMKEYGVPDERGSRLNIKLSQESLAQMLGASRESVNKCLRTLQGQGIISYYYGKLVILDPSALRSLAEKDQLSGPS